MRPLEYESGAEVRDKSDSRFLIRLSPRKGDAPKQILVVFDCLQGLESGDRFPCGHVPCSELSPIGTIECEHDTCLFGEANIICSDLRRTFLSATDQKA
jgi:hypothetical protein